MSIQKLLHVDLHTHPLDHTYYNNDIRVVKELSEFDKKRIREFIDWGIARKLDAMAITDHDMVQSSVWGKQYAEENNLPIKIITGMEAEIQGIHLLCLGITKLPNWESHWRPELLINQVRDMGGVVIMSHPLRGIQPVYLRELYNKGMLDGAEIYNAGTHVNVGIKKCFNQKVYPKLMAFSNSDCHYPGSFPDKIRHPMSEMPFPKYHNIIPEEWLRKHKLI